MNEVSKNLTCVVLRNGIEFWIEDERATALKELLLNGDNKFIEYDGELFNRADIVGVFKAHTMAEHTRRKNGEWQCSLGEWHNKHQKCECSMKRKDYTEPENQEITEEQQQKNIQALNKLKEQIGVGW